MGIVKKDFFKTAHKKLSLYDVYIYLDIAILEFLLGEPLVNRFYEN